MRPPNKNQTKNQVIWAAQARVRAAIKAGLEPSEAMIEAIRLHVPGFLKEKSWKEDLDSLLKLGNFTHSGIPDDTREILTATCPNGHVGRYTISNFYYGNSRKIPYCTTCRKEDSLEKATDRVFSQFQLRLAPGQKFKNMSTKMVYLYECGHEIFCAPPPPGSTRNYRCSVCCISCGIPREKVTIRSGECKKCSRSTFNKRRREIRNNNRAKGVVGFRNSV
jgi:hypothetical protein